MAATLRTDPPHGWREGRGGDLACPHRDVSVCPACAAANPEAMVVAGVHLWIPDPEDRAALREGIRSSRERRF